MKSTQLLLFLTTLLLHSLVAAEEGTFDVKEFVEGKCYGCHDTSVYTRDNRLVNSHKELEVQVRRCDTIIGTALFDDDVETVVNYLNTNYYKFAK